MALCIEWCNTIDELINQQVLCLNSLLQQTPFTGFIETVPAYTTLTIYYQPGLIVKENANPFLFVKNYVVYALMRREIVVVNKIKFY